MELVVIIILVVVIVTAIAYRSINNLDKYDKIYDRLLNELMDNGIPIKVSAYTARFEGTEFQIWVGNYPYDYGCHYPHESLYPSMRTRRRLANYLITNSSM